MAKKKPLSPRTKRYAKLRGRGLSRRKAAEKAGFGSKRAKRGVTGCELERDPRIQKLMADEMAKEMNQAEVKNRLAAIARGEIPSKVVVGSDGCRAEYEGKDGLVAITRVLGMNSETHRFEMPEDREEALKELQDVLKDFGVEATVEEISAKLESAK